MPASASRSPVRTSIAAAAFTAVALLLTARDAIAVDPPRVASRIAARMGAARNLVRRRGPVASIEREHLRHELAQADAELTRADAVLRAEPSHVVLEHAREEADVANTAWYHATVALREARAAHDASPTEATAAALQTAQSAATHAAIERDATRSHVSTAHNIFRHSPAARADRAARARRHEVAEQLAAHGEVVAPPDPWPFDDDNNL